MIKKLCFIIALSLVFACGPIPEDAPVESGQTITAPDGFSIACSVNYYRASPHLCLNNALTTEVWNLSTSGACDNHTLTSVPSNARMVIITGIVTITSSNVVNLKSVQVQPWSDLGCTAAVGIGMQWSLREFAAVVANTQIFSQQVIAFLIPVGGTVIASTATFTNTGTGTFVSMRVMGYYD